MTAPAADQLEIPGEVYLCRVNETLSCGACCGLYNVAHISRRGLEQMLQHRTRLFAQVPRNLNAILAYRENIERRESQPRPFSGFHHCPYIGFVGRSVGCLLHPMAEGNDGVDWRGLSYYGGMACRIYFCPTYRDLADRHKAIVRDVAQNWYDYGLVITEAQLLNSFFGHLEARIERSLNTEDLARSSKFAAALRELLQLKLRWPYRDPHRSLCHYFFKDRHHPKVNIDYDALETYSSMYDTILVELNSTFHSARELRQADGELDRLFERLTAALKSGSGSRAL
jgi:hypothetical protein